MICLKMKTNLAAITFLFMAFNLAKEVLNP